MKAKTLTYIKKNPGITTHQLIKDIYSPGSRSFIYGEIKTLVQEGSLEKIGSALYLVGTAPAKEVTPSILDSDSVTFPLPKGLKVRDLTRATISKEPILDFTLDNPDQINLTMAFLTNLMHLIYVMKLQDSVDEMPWLKALLNENERLKGLKNND